MLSIEECRALIPDGDNEVIALRADLYEMAGLALEVWALEKSKDASGSHIKQQ
jgi:hypothetical protein